MYVTAEPREKLKKRGLELGIHITSLLFPWYPAISSNLDESLEILDSNFP
jgi:hypothetical protein